MRETDERDERENVRMWEGERERGEGGWGGEGEG